MNKAACLLVVALAGCASTPTSNFDKIDAQTAQALQGVGMLSVEVMPGKEFAHYSNAEQAMLASGIMFGAIGGAIGAASANASANRRGGALMAAAGMTDPSLAVADKLRLRLPAERMTTHDANIRLSLTTNHWVMQQGNVGYFVGMQVIDAPSSRVMTKGECKYFRKAQEIGSTNEALLADSAAGLKQEYDRAAEHCADFFARTLFAVIGQEAKTAANMPSDL